MLDDDSVLGLGQVLDADVYEVTAEVQPGTITSLRLEVLTDSSLPGGGPGRTTRGNFVLNELVLRAAGTDVPLANARADFYQKDRPWLAETHSSWLACSRMISSLRSIRSVTSANISAATGLRIWS